MQREPVTISGMRSTSFDVIGDIHGEFHQLEALLGKLGYRNTRGAWQHPERTAVFVGDLIDRGPEQLAVLRAVRAMVDTGAAVCMMGNHEFNAIAWATVREDGTPVRKHTEQNARTHGAFLRAVGDGSSEHRAWIDWFKTLPMWTDLGGLRVVHACWDPASMGVLGGPALTDEQVLAERGSDVYNAIEIVLKGPEIALGDRFTYLDKDGTARTKARIAWWDLHADTLDRFAEMPGDLRTPDGSPFGTLPATPIDRSAYPGPPDDGIPVAYGHYWRSGEIRLAGPRAVCVDYSVAKGGPLVAYRWDGEADLDPVKLVAAGR